MDCFDPVGIAATLLGCPVASAEPAAGGRNAGVWKIDSPAGVFALKHYWQDDGAARRRAECAALRFLEQRGVENVPRLRAEASDPHVVLLTWLDGDAVRPINATDIEECAGFVCTLHRLSRNDAAASLPLAKEACLSGREIVRQIEARIRRLEADDPLPEPIREHLFDGIRPFFKSVRGAAEAACDDLPVQYRTLSPSDFGCHNAVRRPDGRLAYFDFEYFGWDDPVKLTADYVLHPGMFLSAKLARKFIRIVEPIFSADHGFADRLEAYLPLYRARWALIVLNPILASAAGGKPSRDERDKMVKDCLEKSQRLLDRSAGDMTLGSCDAE